MTAPGIPGEKLEEVFQPFCRLEEYGAAAWPGEPGLGLAIARDIARRNGAENQPGQPPEGGLRATLNIPLAPDA